MTIFLGSIGFELGASAAIASCAEIAEQPEVLSHLTTRGLSHYLVSELAPAQLAARSVIQSLRKSGLAAASIDGVIYASSTSATPAQRTTDIGEFCRATGLKSVVPTGLYLAECGNFASALRVGQAFIESGRYHNILIITADVVGKDGRRLVDGNLSVSSDGAASCLLSRSRNAGTEFELLSVAQNTNQDLWGIDLNTSFPLFAKLFAEGVAKTFGDAFALCAPPMAAADVGHLVTNNYNLEILGMFAALSNIPVERLYTGTVGTIAHVFSSDNLINLQTLIDEGRVGAGEHLAALSTGVCTWGVSVLKRVAGPLDRSDK